MNEKRKKKFDIDTVPEVYFSGADSSSFLKMNYPVEDMCTRTAISEGNDNNIVGNDFNGNLQIERKS